MEARKKAVTTKYLQYITDPRYRRLYRDRIYYNVNKDVPETDQLHMHGVLVIGANEEPDTSFDPEITEAVRQMSSSPTRRRNKRSKNRTEQSTGPEDEQNSVNYIFLNQNAF